jgi:hypothetical protein
MGWDEMRRTKVKESGLSRLSNRSCQIVVRSGSQASVCRLQRLSEPARQGLVKERGRGAVLYCTVCPGQVFLIQIAGSPVSQAANRKPWEITSFQPLCT